MKTYDSPGNVITFTVPAADFANYPAADMAVAIGAHVGITEGPVDLNTGELNVAVQGVFHCEVEHTGEAARNVPVYLDGADLTTTEGDVRFGTLIDGIAAGTQNVRVKLNG